MRRNLFFAVVLLYCVCGVSARAQFVSSFGVTKTGYYVQSSDSTPVLDSVDPFEFYVYVVDGGLSVIDIATVALPGGLGTIDLLSLGLAGVEYFSSQTAMNNTYKNGAYTFTVTDEDSDVLYESLTLSGDAYPTIPQLRNYAALHSINASADLTLQWLPFVGGTTGDRIAVDIEDGSGSVFTSEVDGTVSSVVIPAGTLRASVTYDVYLDFDHVVNVNATSALGEAVYARDTYTTIKTSAGGTVTASIASYSMVPNGPFQVQVSGTPGATFTLETTPDFGGWTPVDSMTLPTGSGTLSDSNAAANPRRFYRVKAM